MKKLFPTNFVRIQEPPLLHVREREDGAIVVEPPKIGGEGQTYTGTETATGSISKSGTETNQGTSTNTTTGSQTGGAVLLDKGSPSFPIIREFVTGCSPKTYLDSAPRKPDAFELKGAIPSGRFEEPQDNLTLSGDRKLTDVQVVGEIRRPELPSKDVGFVLPDLTRPTPSGGWGTAADDDSDDDGDEDDDTDSDNDNDSDDEPDEDTRPDFVDVLGFESVRKSLKVRAPLSGGQKGRMEPNR